MIATTVTVSLDRQLPLSIVTAKQGDTGRAVVITVETQYETYDIETATAVLYVKKPDGTKIYNTCINNGDGTFIVGLTNQCLAVAGDAQAELQLTSTEAPTEWISTPVFILRVLPSNIDDTAIESSDEFDALQTAMTTLATYDTINELPLVNMPSAKTSLADAFDAQGNNKIAYFRCSSITTDSAPGAQNAGVLSFKYSSGSGSYGCQLSLSGAGLYVRTCWASTWSAWAQLATV